MEMKSWTTVDKSAWARGPWDSEPDKMQWVDEATGLPCLIHRAYTTGGLCGYVGVSAGHALFEVSGEDGDIDVHGGLNFFRHCMPAEDESSGICHVVGTDEDDNVWWLGFDCSHVGDVSPAIDALVRSTMLLPMENQYRRLFGADVYRDIEYVRQQCAELAMQLHTMQPEV